MSRSGTTSAILVYGAAVALVALAGCGGNELETGFKPQPLGSSAAVRRGYYASPYTPEAKAAEVERDQEQDLRRPKPGY